MNPNQSKLTQTPVTTEAQNLPSFFKNGHLRLGESLDVISKNLRLSASVIMGHFSCNNNHSATETTETLAQSDNHKNTQRSPLHPLSMLDGIRRSFNLGIISKFQEIMRKELVSYCNSLDAQLSPQEVRDTSIQYTEELQSRFLDTMNTTRPDKQTMLKMLQEEITRAKKEISEKTKPLDV
jgi:hypothetical protein